MRKFVSGNYVFVVTDTSPAKIIRVSISPPGYTIYTLTGFEYAKDLVVDVTKNKVYVSCNDGKVAEVDITTPTTQVQKNASESVQLYNITVDETYNNQYITSASSSGVVYIIQGALAYIFNTDLRIRRLLENKIISTVLNWMRTFTIFKTDLRTKESTGKIINTDFRYTKYTPDTMVSLKREDFIVKVDGVGLTGLTDIKLDSIQIDVPVDAISSASFILARNYDNPDVTLEGVSSQITNKNVVTIYIGTRLIFTGLITKIRSTLAREEIEVTAEARKNTQLRLMRTPAPFNFGTKIEYVEFVSTKTVDLPLPILDTQLSIYDILSHTVSLNHPLTLAEADETDMGYYKGIKVNLGVERKEIITRGIDYINGWAGVDAWNPFENFDHFYVINATLDAPFSTVGTQQELVNAYIGTSLIVKDDLWLLGALHGVIVYWQRVYDVVETDLGYYYIGIAPYKEISVPNGRFISAYKYEDKADGLYEVKEVSYDYEQYAKDCAQAEYWKLDLYAGSSSSVNITLDAFLYYNIQMLDKINIVNTKQVGIYKNLNGFPMSIKRITLSSGDMIASLSMDTTKSSMEGWTITVNPIHPVFPWIIESATSYYPEETDKIEKYEEKLFQKIDPHTIGDVT